MPLSEALRKQLTTLIAKDEVVLFMKGNRRSPACGFSAQVVQILDDLLPAYATVDVLADPAVRDGIKELSEWPTIPQLYVGGVFVGGCDIVKELNASGELGKLLGAEQAAVPVPGITMTAAAAVAFRDALGEPGADVLRFEVSPRFEYQLFLGPKEKGDVEVRVALQPAGEAEGAPLVLHLDRSSARRADGTSIDFVEGPSGGGFKIENPAEPPRVRQLGPPELQKMLAGATPPLLLDVRTERERAIASIETARLFDEAAQQEVAGLDRSTPLVFHCHHGGRSQAAADHYLAQGFTNVSNLRGGIDAWSREVDPRVPRY